MLIGLRLSASVSGVWPMSPWSLLVRFCEPHCTMHFGPPKKSAIGVVSQPFCEKVPVAVTFETATRGP